jgi:hypothetical protein
MSPCPSYLESPSGAACFFCGLELEQHRIDTPQAYVSREALQVVIGWLERGERQGGLYLDPLNCAAIRALLARTVTEGA